MVSRASPRRRAVTSRIDWVRQSCRLLSGIADEFAATRPFAGLTIGTGIHLEPKTVALILTLASGGARMISTGNLSSTQPDTVSYLRHRGVQVVGDATTDGARHAGYLREVLGEKPDLLLDNGGDLFVSYLGNPYPGLLGGTEETTSGRMRLKPLAPTLDVPVLVINDSPIKQFAENRHAVGQSVLESYLRITNRMTNGRRVLVFGYGACGRGIAAAFRSAYAAVSVVETDPVARLEACPRRLRRSRTGGCAASGGRGHHRDGGCGCRRWRRPRLAEGRRRALQRGALPDRDRRRRADRITGRRGVETTGEGIATIRLADGRRVHLLAGGHMVNLAGPRPLGNSIESMDLGFALQARCLEAIATGSVDGGNQVIAVPRFIDEMVAQAFLDAYGASARPRPHEAG